MKERAGKRRDVQGRGKGQRFGREGKEGKGRNVHGREKTDKGMDGKRRKEGKRRDVKGWENMQKFGR